MTGAELGGNISSVVLSGIFAGNYQSVADIKSAMGITPLAGDDTEGLKICRRTNTSGTQAGHSHLWLGSNYCGANTKIASFVDEAFDDNNVANGWPVNYDVVENSSSSNVENCVITVADQGPGIAKEIQSELFQPFSSFGKRNGLGLGLALSKETVVDHGGEIWATQGAPKGAVFHVKLPVG